MSDGYGRSAPNPLTRDQTIGLVVRTCLEEGITDHRQIAYVLATTQHESADFTKPEEDYGRQQATRLGYQGGEEFFGRGYAHLTHRDNYRRLGAAIGRGDDLVNAPPLAADPEVAAKVMVVGMRDGLFTSRRLDEFIGTGAADYEGARRVINGVDRNVEIAALARRWEGQVAGLVEGVQRDGVALIRTPPVRAGDAPIQRGDANARVFDLQQYLKQLDVRNDAGREISPDGDFGDSSLQAVRNYQRNAGITPANGQVGQGLFDRIRGEVQQAHPDFRLRSFTELHGPLNDRVLNHGDRGDPVFELRGQLAGLGYLDRAGSPYNSRYDADTQQAVRRFQRDENIAPANGLADEATRDAINARAVERGLPETTDAIARRALPPQPATGRAPQPERRTQRDGVEGPETQQRQGSLQEPAGADVAARVLAGEDRLFERILAQVHSAERERGIAPGEYSRNLAGVLTVASLREGVRPDRVELNRDGSGARAVEVSAMGDHPAFNRNTALLDTAVAASTPARQSAEEADRLQAQRDVEQREAATRQLPPPQLAATMPR